MKLTGSYLNNELLKVLYSIITGLPGNLLFSLYLLKVEKAAPEPSPGHTLVNRITLHYKKICYQGMVLRLVSATLRKGKQAASKTAQFAEQPPWWQNWGDIVRALQISCTSSSLVSHYL